VCLVALLDEDEKHEESSSAGSENDEYGADGELGDDESDEGGTRRVYCLRVMWKLLFTPLSVIFVGADEAAEEKDQADEADPDFGDPDASMFCARTLLGSFFTRVAGLSVS